MTSKELQDKVRGSLVGGAVGDALGYPVEFMSYDQIVAKYGENGITRFQLNANGVAEISDDTQMTLFTANGLLNGFAKYPEPNVKYWGTEFINESYLDWFKTQIQRFGTTVNDKCWLMKVPQLYDLRAPGNTCMFALQSRSYGQNPFNDSKGCGGIMRVAPIALFGASHGKEVVDMTEVGCEAARLTHQHPLGWLPSGLLVYVIQKALEHKGELSKKELLNYVYDGLYYLENVIQDNSGHTFGARYKNDFDTLSIGTLYAVKLSESDCLDVDAISKLGQGWTGEEAWFISLYCTLRHFDSFENAVVAAVNHSGDSDSTGAITGNLIGAIYGYSAIPDYFKENLELREVIETMADDLYTGKISRLERKSPNIDLT